jgi:hypothetical protein
MWPEPIGDAYRLVICRNYFETIRRGLLDLGSGLFDWGRETIEKTTRQTLSSSKQKKCGLSVLLLNLMMMMPNSMTAIPLSKPLEIFGLTWIVI